MSSEFNLGVAALPFDDGCTGAPLIEAPAPFGCAPGDMR